jgi:hypothetical protein
MGMALFPPKIPAFDFVGVKSQFDHMWSFLEGGRNVNNER